jgi:hypothetical protein
MALCVILLIAGCAQNKTPYDMVKTGATKTIEADSYEYTGSMVLKLDSQNIQDTENGVPLSMLSNMELKYNGIINTKAEQASVNLEFLLKGDMSFSIAIPIVVDKGTLYIKIPQTPFVPLPEELVGKYVRVTPEDLKKLEEADGDEPAPSLNPEAQKQFNKDMSALFNKHFGKDANLVKVNVKDAGGDIPADVKQVAEYSITNENFQQVVEKLAKGVVPDLLTVLSKPEYKEIASNIPADAQQQYAEAIKDFDKEYAEVKDTLKINEAKVQLGVNNAGYLSYFRQASDFAIDDAAAGKSTVNMTMDVKMTNFNKETPPVQIPSDQDSLSVDELVTMFGLSMDGMN